MQCKNKKKLCRLPARPHTPPSSYICWTLSSLIYICRLVRRRRILSAHLKTFRVLPLPLSLELFAVRRRLCACGCWLDDDDQLFSICSLLFCFLLSLGFGKRASFSLSLYRRNLRTKHTHMLDDVDCYLFLIGEARFHVLRLKEKLNWTANSAALLSLVSNPLKFYFRIDVKCYDVFTLTFFLHTRNLQKLQPHGSLSFQILSHTHTHDDMTVVCTLEKRKMIKTLI